MQILIVVATNLEIKPFAEIMHKYPDVKVLTTGIGMVATAFALGKELTVNNYDLVINAGIAGSYNRNINIGEVVNVITDRIVEMGADDGENFIPFNKLDIERLSQSTNDDGFLVNNSIIENQVINNLKKVNGITVNTIQGNENKIKKMVDTFDPDIETMEGAAVFYSCHSMDIPFFQIRAVSNYIEKRNTANWNIKKAIENLNYTLINIIDGITA
jgi:futalosine hydrolase